MFSFSRLCTLSDTLFDPILNKKFLLECLKLYLKCKDEHDSTYGLAEEMSTLSIDKTNKILCDHLLMEALYIMCNLNDLSPLYRYINLPKIYKR